MSDTSLPRVPDDDDLFRAFAQWLDAQDEVVAPTVEDEVALLRELAALARAEGSDLGGPHGFDVVMNRILGSLLDTPEPKGQEATSGVLARIAVLEEYAEFRADTEDDPAEWDQILDVFERASSDPED